MSVCAAGPGLRQQLTGWDEAATTLKPQPKATKPQPQRSSEKLKSHKGAQPG